MAEFARAERFKDLRSKKGLSQADMGHEIGVSEKSWRAWAHGGGIKPYNVRKVVDYFKVNPEEIVERESLSANGEEPVESVDPYVERLDEINEKLDEILRRLDRDDDVQTDLRDDQDSQQAARVDDEPESPEEDLKRQAG